MSEDAAEYTAGRPAETRMEHRRPMADGMRMAAGLEAWAAQAMHAAVAGRGDVFGEACHEIEKLASRARRWARRGG